MYTVYVLKDRSNKLYKGMTNNIKRRMAEHKNGHTITTSKMLNPKLIYSEEYKDFEQARKREQYLKTAAGRKFLKETLKE